MLLSTIDSLRSSYARSEAGIREAVRELIRIFHKPEEPTPAVATAAPSSELGGASVPAREGRKEMLGGPSPPAADAASDRPKGVSHATPGATQGGVWDTPKAAAIVM